MTTTACDDQFAPDPSSREAAIDAMVMEVQPHEWRQGGIMRYQGYLITWEEYVTRRHELEEEFTVEPVLDRDEMLQLLALRLKSWPQDCDDCERTEPIGWGWRWYDVPPDCEFVLGVDGTLGEEWCITERDWQKACWDAGEKRIDEFARSKYHREIKPGVFVDVYDVLKAFDVRNGALQHLIKKALAPGQRGHKDIITDLDDIIASAKRAKELEQ